MMIRTLRTIAICLAVQVPPQQPATSAHIEGTVVDAATNMPLANAPVGLMVNVAHYVAEQVFHE